MAPADTTGPPRCGWLASLCAVGTLLPSPEGLEFLRALCALGLVLYLPGACVLQAASPGRPAGTEMQVLRITLSLALAVLAGLCLNLAGALTPHGWALALWCLSMAGSVAGVVTRRLGTEVGVSALARPPGRRGAGRTATAAVILCGACLLAICSLSLARTGALAHKEYRFTEFWLVPEINRPTVATLGVHNGEQVPTDYEVDVVAGGDVLARWPAITLSAGETRTVPFAVPASAFGRRVEAWLYKDGERNRVYRKVWMAVPGVTRSSRFEE